MFTCPDHLLDAADEDGRFVRRCTTSVPSGDAPPESMRQSCSCGPGASEDISLAPLLVPGPLPNWLATSQSNTATPCPRSGRRVTDSRGVRGVPGNTKRRRGAVAAHPLSGLAPTTYLKHNDRLGIAVEQVLRVS